MGFFEEKIGGVVVRAGETFTCVHCNAVFEMVRGEPEYRCPKESWRRVCFACENRYHPGSTCLGAHFEKRLERMEARDRLRRSILG